MRSCKKNCQGFSVIWRIWHKKRKSGKLVRMETQQEEKKVDLLAANCISLMSRSFLSPNEAGGRRTQCVCVCVFLRQKAETHSGDLMESGRQLIFTKAVWYSLEGMCGWITLLAATATFQSGSTLSSPLSNPRRSDHVCKMKTRPEVRCLAHGGVNWSARREIKPRLVRK